MLANGLRPRPDHIQIRFCCVNSLAMPRALRYDWRNKVFAQFVDRFTLFEARAGPNQRLVGTFGIQNALTTVRPDYHKIFMNIVIAQLKTTEWEWSAMSTSAVGFVRDDLAQGDLETGILLVPLVQKVVSKIVLLEFFLQEAQLEDDAAIATAAECIKSTLDLTPNEQYF